ncbi:MAG: bifunctional hydroxymethylpyrimidine kinase/phosphomethylpyrimidine kinase [Paludibacteraceae bacterium]|nr:bifunctional hydroxymethylpyrimidine kinase/phosphomethylpyrimidine kinase [Paludibacteraceae bacterium]
MKNYKRVLTIAGSDSGGGAGIQADIKTISACGCYAMSAITAITAQNTLGVNSVTPIPVSAIEEQITAVLDDIEADAIKIGMLHSQEVVECVGKMLNKYAIKDVVLDPVMVSTSGHRLIEESAIDSLINNLFPHVRIITPNIPEAEILLSANANRLSTLSQADLGIAARELGQRYHLSVLLKAGHLTEDKLVDILYDHEKGEMTELPSKRIYTKNTHGTGCTMSSALASYLAKGLPLKEATQAAKTYIDEAIAAGAEYQIGRGFGPVAHFYSYWK